MSAGRKQCRLWDKRPTRCSEWVPVSERLPPYTTEVLVYCADAQEIGWAYLLPDRWHMPEPQCIGYDAITHWMPLPAPPASSVNRPRPGGATARMDGSSEGAK